MVLLGYFYREAREAASIDAAWRVATEALDNESPARKSLGTAALKSMTGSTVKTMPQPITSTPRQHPQASTSYFASLTRHASNLASTVGLTSISEHPVTPGRDGSMFEFSEAERQRASSILDSAAAAAAAKEAADHSGAMISASSCSVGTAVMSSSARPSMNVGLSSSHSAEFRARGRSSSIWSGSAASSSVTQRGRNFNPTRVNST